MLSKIFIFFSFNILEAVSYRIVEDTVKHRWKMQWFVPPPQKKINKLQSQETFVKTVFFHQNMNKISFYKFFMVHYDSLSLPGSIFQILTCLIGALWVHATYLFIDSFIKSCDSPDWSIPTCYQSASSRVTINHFFTQKCFSVENLIIVSQNNVIPITVIV